jgi:AraC-like DNA-binding protein
MMKLHIKNMVSSRCRLVVKEELEKFGLHVTIAGSGEAQIKESLSAEMRRMLEKELAKKGFEVLDEKRSRLIEQIKGYIAEMVHYSDDQIKNNFPVFLSCRINISYAFLDKLFWEVNNMSIESFFILQKIEKVKELLVDYKLHLPEIAFQLNYISETQLLTQFRNVTGYSPTHFLKIKRYKNSELENIRIS